DRSTHSGTDPRFRQSPHSSNELATFSPPAILLPVTFRHDLYQGPVSPSASHPLSSRLIRSDCPRACPVRTQPPGKSTSPGNHVNNAVVAARPAHLSSSSTHHGPVAVPRP